MSARGSKTEKKVVIVPETNERSDMWELCICIQMDERTWRAAGQDDDGGDENECE